MSIHVLPRSGWNESEAQPGQSESRGPRGAVWVIAALYLFCALVFAGWLGGWDENGPRTADPPPQHQHSIHPQG